MRPNWQKEGSNTHVYVQGGLKARLVKDMSNTYTVTLSLFDYWEHGGIAIAYHGVDLDAAQREAEAHLKAQVIILKARLHATKTL